MKKFTAEQRLAIVSEANDAMPGIQYDWSDFERFVHAHFGTEGLSYSVLYNALKGSGLVDMTVGGPVRKRQRS